MDETYFYSVNRQGRGRLIVLLRELVDRVEMRKTRSAPQRIAAFTCHS